ncbi:MAG TPA: hypothetical protein VGF73_11245 [Chthoniobacterales bacterium]
MHGSLGKIAAGAAFTIVEILVVISIILVLAGLVLATSGYVYNKGARSRAEAEIAAMSAALENYKADNGTFPTSGLLPTESDPTKYFDASEILYASLCGDTDGDGQPGPGTSYMAFKSNQLGADNGKTFVKDPFGNSYGYSTAGPTSGGYNPTFDLWSTANSTTTAQWVKNW